MDQTQLQEKIALYYSKLPPDVQTVFSSMKWMEMLGEISKKYTLTEPQIETLGTETTLVLLGIIDATEYEEIIEKEISIPVESRQKMMNEINTTILNTIRPQLADAFLKNATELEKESPTTLPKIDDRFSILPPEVQNAIAESNYQKKLYSIATKYKLQVNKMGALEDVTVKLIAGTLSPSQYERELALATDLPADKVRELASEVNDEILKNIRTQMKKDDTALSNATLEDEVPIPPYKVESVPQNVVVAKEKTAPAQTQRTSIPTPLPPTTPPKVERVPPPDQGLDMLASKLRNVTISKSSVSDHSLPKLGVTQAAPVASAVVSKAHDPYKEAIE